MSNHSKQQFHPLLLISALRQESSVILRQYQHSKEKTPQGYILFRFQKRGIFLLEIGSGKGIDRSKLKSAIVQINPGFIVNFGICGALTHRVELNKNYLARSISYDNESEIDLSHDLNLLNSLFNSRSVLQSVRLLTVRNPVLDSIKRDKLQQITACELVDMEAYFVAQTARELKIPIAILKQVTDYSDQRALQQIKQNKKIWQESLQQGLSGILNL